jgi:broad specificity phosphatase PhoE
VTRPDGRDEAGSTHGAGSDPARQEVWLVRHGETQWSLEGRHTGRTDVPLTVVGRTEARRLSRCLGGHEFARVISSPMSRAAETARLAGFPNPLTDPDLREWDYGAFEGRTRADIREHHPNWSIWNGPWPNGETIEHIAGRADRLVERLRAIDGDVLVFAHGHVLRVMAARWLGLPADAGRHLALGTATISRVGWERETPVIETWNEACR